MIVPNYIYRKTSLVLTICGETNLELFPFILFCGNFTWMNPKCIPLAPPFSWGFGHISNCLLDLSRLTAHPEINRFTFPQQNLILWWEYEFPTFWGMWEFTFPHWLSTSAKDISTLGHWASCGGRSSAPPSSSLGVSLKVPCTWATSVFTVSLLGPLLIVSPRLRR